VWGNAKAEDVILAGALASKQEDKDPIDQAVLQALRTRRSSRPTGG
jgi:hypothetical protein